MCPISKGESKRLEVLMEPARNAGIYVELQNLISEGQELSGQGGTYFVSFDDVENERDIVWMFCRFLSYSYVTIIRYGSSYTDNDDIIASMYSTSGSNLAFEVFLFVKRDAHIQ